MRGMPILHLLTLGEGKNSIITELNSICMDFSCISYLYTFSIYLLLKCVFHSFLIFFCFPFISYLYVFSIYFLFICVSHTFILKMYFRSISYLYVISIHFLFICVFHTFLIKKRFLCIF